MTILRSGATTKYSSNWNAAFGESKKPKKKKKAVAKKKSTAVKGKKKTAKK